MVVKDRALLFDILHTLVDPAPLLAQVHDRADVLRGHHDLCLDHRFFHIVDLRRVRHVRRIRQVDYFSVCLVDLINNARRGRHEIQIVLSLQPLLDDLQMKEPQESAAETESQSHRRLCLELERSVIELELFKGIPQVRILGPVRRIEPAVHHGIDLLIPGERLRTRILGIGDRIAHPGFFYILQARRDVADHPGIQFLAGDELPCPECADLHDLCLCPGGHHEDRGSFPHSSLLDPAEYDHAFIGVVLGIKDQRLERGFRISLRCGDLLYDLLQHFMDILAGLRRNERSVVRLNADDVLDLFLDPFGIRARQVDLIDHGHHVQVMVQRQVHIRQRLRLHPLRRVHHEDRSVAGGKASGDFIVKVHMPRSIDEIEDILLPVVRLIHRPDCLGFDRDASLPLQVHVVQHLGLHLAAGQKPGHLDDPVCQGGFPVIDMRNNTKVPYLTLIYN